MSITTTCREGVTAETLSAWADGELSEAQAEHLRAHLPTCPACQQTYAAYRDLDAQLRGIHIPATRSADVAAIRGASSTTRVHGAARRFAVSPAVLGGASAALVVTLLIVAFAQTLMSDHRLLPGAAATETASEATAETTLTPGANSTAQIGSTSPFRWSQRTLPPGLILNTNDSLPLTLNFAFSPANSQDGWFCTPTPDHAYTIWETTDQARSWHVASILSKSSPLAVMTGCTLYPDSLDPSVLGLIVWEQTPTDSGGRPFIYVSHDGGASWHAWSVGYAHIYGIATFKGNTYVMAQSYYAWTSQGEVDGKNHPSLFVSDGKLISWRPLNSGPANQFWIDPKSGALYFEADGAQGNQLIWRSINGGATWTNSVLRLPDGLNTPIESASSGWVTAVGALRICIQGYTSNTMFCTVDTGKTWTTIPLVSQGQACQSAPSSCRPGDFTTSDGSCAVVAVSLDGSFYAECAVAKSATIGLPIQVFRLAYGATSWRSLPLPTSLSPAVPTPLPGTPLTGSNAAQPLDVANIQLAGDNLWYSDPLQGIFAVAAISS